MSRADEPAFPVVTQWRDENGKSFSGLTLRQYYAGLAMQGMSGRDTYDAGQATPEQRAKLAVIEADALLAALERGKE
jgi:hypothetical protein